MKRGYPTESSTTHQTQNDESLKEPVVAEHTTRTESLSEAGAKSADRS